MKRRNWMKRIAQSYENGTGMFSTDISKYDGVEPALFKTVVKKPWTYTVVAVKIDGSYHLGDGFSKVCYPDEFDADVGTELSRKRAVHDLAGKLWQVEQTPSALFTVLALEGEYSPAVDKRSAVNRALGFERYRLVLETLQ